MSRASAGKTSNGLLSALSDRKAVIAEKWIRISFVRGIGTAKRYRGSTGSRSARSALLHPRTYQAGAAAATLEHMTEAIGVAGKRGHPGDAYAHSIVTLSQSKRRRLGTAVESRHGSG